MKYDIHLFAVVRVKVAGVEALDEKKAVKVAEGVANLNSIFEMSASEAGKPYIAQTEFDDQITHALVEPAGNGARTEPAAAKCFEPFGRGKHTEVPFDNVSTHIAARS